jgi:predicted house-cleaning noncanonical NTP pyrophosphatase (MazG superfamily)
MDLMNQIIINTMPRSGSAWLQFLLARAIAPDRRINTSAVPDNNDFVIRMSAPAVLYAKFDDFVQVNIVRDPFEIIPSVITKTYGGIGDTVSNGIAMPSEMPKFDMDGHIKAQISNYNSYAESAIINQKNLKIFTFDQATKDIEHVTKKLLGEDKKLYNDYIPNYITWAKSRIRTHELSEPGYNNALPEKKPDIYYEIKDRLRSHDLERCNTLYDILKEIASSSADALGSSNG